MVTLFGKRMRLFRPRTIWIRRVVQWFFFLLIALIAVNHTLAESGAGISFLSSASLHGVCPFGGVANLYTYFTTGGYVAKLHSAVFIMLIALLVGLALVTGFFTDFSYWMLETYDALGLPLPG